MQKPSVRGPRPLLGCCSWNYDSYEKQRRDDSKSLRIKSRAARRATLEEGEAARAAASAAQVSLHCGSAASNRQLLGSAPACSAAGGARELPLRAQGCSWPRLRPLPSALGQRLPEELRVRERSGKWRRLSQQEWAGGKGGAGRIRQERRRGSRAGWLATARLRGALRLDEVRAPARPAVCPRVWKNPFGLFWQLGTGLLQLQGTARACPASGAQPGGCWPGAAASVFPSEGPARNSSTHPTASPPRGAHVLPASALAVPPRGPAARPPPARRAQLCEVAPIVRPPVASPRLFPGGAPIPRERGPFLPTNNSILCESRLNNFP